MKLVKEILYEKFTEEGDPIKDMGIGGYTFDTLKNGTIIECTKAFGTSLGGVIRGYNDAAKQIRYGSYLLIFNIKRLDKYYISFNYRNAGGPISWGDKELFKKQQAESLETVKRFQKEYKDDPIGSTRNIPKYSGGFISKIGRNKFDNMFKIIERGVDLSESVNEKFIEKSDPIHDMGIGKQKICFGDIFYPMYDEYVKEHGNDFISKYTKPYFKKFKQQVEDLIYGRFVKGHIWGPGFSGEGVIQAWSLKGTDGMLLFKHGQFNLDATFKDRKYLEMWTLYLNHTYIISSYL